MEADQDTDLLLLKQRGHHSLPSFFGHIHPLVGSDILCSPRGFGPGWILKTCIDFSAYIFEPGKGIQNLKDDECTSVEACSRFILALFKKRHPNQIKMKAEEMFGETSSITNALDQAREDTWIQNLDSNTTLPSRECLDQRGLNLAYQ